MKKNFICKIVIFFCIIALAFIAVARTNRVLGETNLSFKFNATPNSEVVKEGEIVKISLKISDINAGKEGINTISFKVNYDESFFEDLSINSKNNWSITYNNEKDNEQYGKALAILLSSGVTKDQEIGEVTLKVKNNLNIKSGAIKFTEVSTNNGTSIIEGESKTINISLIEEGSQANTINKEENFDTSLTQQVTEEKNGWIKFVVIAIILVVIVIIGTVYIIKSKKSKN